MIHWNVTNISQINKRNIDTLFDVYTLFNTNNKEINRAGGGLCNSDNFI